MKMKHLLYILLVLLVSLSTAGCALLPARLEAAATPGTTQDTLPWEIVLQREIAQPMRVAAFLDGGFGVTGGPSDPGRAHYTTDGGQTWTMAESSGA
jgi:hypothetical protein